jgi:hypothetical protein
MKKLRIVERTNKKGYQTYHIQDKIKYIPWSWRDVEVSNEYGYNTIEAAIYALHTKYAPPIIEDERVVYTNFKQFDY